MAKRAAGFTAVVCNACTTTEPGLSVLDALRVAVRRCAHGMLISSGCLLDQVSCAGRTDGVMVLVQPCAADRTPAGPAVLFGPIDNAEAAAHLREWLVRGQWAVPPPGRWPATGNMGKLRVAVVHGKPV